MGFSRFFSFVFAVVTGIASVAGGTDSLWLTAYYMYVAAILGWLSPSVLVMMNRDLQKYVIKNMDEYQKLDAQAQTNSEDLIRKLRTIVDTPKFLYRKINNLHNYTFPQTIAQTGAVGRQIIKQNTKGQGSARQSRRPSAGSGSGKSSGGSGKNGDDEGGDGEPPRALNLALNIQLLDWPAFAAVLRANEKTLRNQYYKAPWNFPEPIFIPGCRGPRWTPAAVKIWLENQPHHEVKKSKPEQPKIGRGRPRLAHTLGLIHGGVK